MNPIFILIVFFLALPLFGQTKVPGNRDYSGTQNFTGATMRVPNGNANPGTCATGDMFILNTATSGRRVHVCEAGTWVLQGGGADTNTTTSADGELTLFADTSGKLFKRATGTGYVKATSGVAAFSATIPQADVVNLTTDLTARVLTTRQVATGDGLTGGGDLSSNRTISLNVNALTEKVTPVAGTDWIPIYDVAGTAHMKAKWPVSGGPATSITTTSSLPGTCSAGDVKFNTTDGAIYACTATDTWTKLLGSGDGTAAGILKMLEAATNGNNFVAWQAGDSLSADTTYTMPTTPPSGDQVLQCGAPSANVSACQFVAQSGGVPTTRTITAGAGLTGGGDLSANRTLALDVNSLTTKATPTGADYVPIYDVAAGEHKKAAWPTGSSSGYDPRNYLNIATRVLRYALYNGYYPISGSGISISQNVSGSGFEQSTATAPSMYRFNLGALTAGNGLDIVIDPSTKFAANPTWFWRGKFITATPAAVRHGIIANDTTAFYDVFTLGDGVRCQSTSYWVGFQHIAGTDPNWMFRTCNNGALTSTDTGVPFASDTMIAFEWGVSSNSTTVWAKVNGNTITVPQTNIPASTGQVNVRQSVRLQVGAASQTPYIHFHSFALESDGGR